MKKLLIAILLVGCAHTSPLEAPKPVMDHKAMCELKSSSLITAANQAGYTCEQVKPGLDVLLGFDPDCEAYFGDQKVEVICDPAK